MMKSSKTSAQTLLIPCQHEFQSWLKPREDILSIESAWLSNFNFSTLINVFRQFCAFLDFVPINSHTTVPPSKTDVPVTKRILRVK